MSYKKPSSRKRKRVKTNGQLPSTSKSIRTRLKTREWQKPCLAAFTQFMKHTHAEPFLEPVDEELHEAPDYSLIVKSPMDFSAMERKLKEGTYSEIKEFFQDAELVFFNCRMYNVFWDHPVHKNSCSLQKLFKIKFKSLCEKFGKKSDIDAWGPDTYLGPFTPRSD